MSARVLVIGLTADAPGVGKTTAAFSLRTIRDRCAYVPFASALKRMIEALLLDAGISEARVHRYMREAKQETIPELGHSTRTMMQTLGTEWGRQQLDPNFWVTVWKAKVQRIISNELTHLIVVDDVRFKEEAEAIRKMGGELWRITREQRIELDRPHASEGGLANWPVDRIIANDGTIADLTKAVRQALKLAEQRHQQALERVGIYEEVS